MCVEGIVPIDFHCMGNKYNGIQSESKLFI